MSEYPLLASIDPHHQRIGYVTALCTIATRDYSTRDALTSRLKDLLFRKVYRDESLFEQLLNRVASQHRDELLAKARLNAANPDLSPSSILAAPDRQQPWLTLNTFWLHDNRMPSSLGELTEKKTFRIVDFARMLSILLPGHDLSENGFLIKHLLEELQADTAQPLFNPLIPNVRPCLPILYLRFLLDADVLFPFLIAELVRRDEEKIRMQTRGPDGVLLTAVDALLRAIGNPVYPDEILAIQNINAYRNAIARNQSTQENYLRPRLEIMVDLGYLGRSTVGMRKGDFVWNVSASTRALHRELQTRPNPSLNRDPFMDSAFFGAAARSHALPSRPIKKHEEVLLYFTKALMRVKRDFGFTPGRTAALLACLIAWEEHKILEITQVFDAVYHAAKTDLGKYFHFSGGSRFDREFLIRVDDTLQSILEQYLGVTP